MHDQADTALMAGRINILKRDDIHTIAGEIALFRVEPEIRVMHGDRLLSDDSMWKPGPAAAQPDSPAR